VGTDDEIEAEAVAHSVDHGLPKGVTNSSRTDVKQSRVDIRIRPKEIDGQLVGLHRDVLVEQRAANFVENVQSTSVKTCSARCGSESVEGWVVKASVWQLAESYTTVPCMRT
jgi:hypothetical protein